MNVSFIEVEKKKKIALPLCIFGGFLGLHRFYEGKILTGILYLFSLGLLGIGWIADIVLLCKRPSIYETKRLDYKNLLGRNGKPLRIRLTDGRYIGGVDIPCGVYRVRALWGRGSIVCGGERISLDAAGRLNRHTYNGVEIAENEIIKIDMNGCVSFKFRRSLAQDLIENIEDRDALEQNIEIQNLTNRLESVKEKNKRKEAEIQKLTARESEYQRIISRKDNEIQNLKSQISSVSGTKDFELRRLQVMISENQKIIIGKDEKIRELGDKISENQARYNEILEELQELKYYQECNENEKNALESELSGIKQEIATLNNKLIREYYTFSDYDQITSEDCKNKIYLLKQREVALRESESDAIVNEWSIQSRKTADRIKRQMLRTFNAECDNIMFNVSLKNIDRSRKQIQNSFSSINKLYSVDGASLQSELLEVKLEEITMAYTCELKRQQEKEIQREIREQMLDEERARKEIEEQKKKIDKDLQQHLGEINRLMKYMQKSQIDAERQLYMDKIRELEDRIKELESDKETVLEREANARAGFVYIISNIGSFGENIYKIGMTRRLEPMDRVKELSSASVPFEFDVHAMIFSSDAPELETTLHRHFADRAVNKVNPRKEFYNVDIDEIERVVKESYNDTVQFTKIPVAAEWRQSLNMLEQGE